jgi:putative Mg2+ transporter-C (MgtC) family protein
VNALTLDSLATFWSAPELATNIIVFLNILGAGFLGILVGYERSYHGRAAGMRTYGLVCMASAALTAIVGYPAFWYGGHAELVTSADPTRVIQGIVTGIGFLGAGVIMKEGFSISGLTTAASIWASSAIGILVGVGFYSAAILLALLSSLSMIWILRFEAWLPSHLTVAISMSFSKGFAPSEEVLRRVALERGYEIVEESIAIAYRDGRPEWHFVAAGLGRFKAAPLSELALELARFEGVEDFSLAHARN